MSMCSTTVRKTNCAGNKSAVNSGAHKKVEIQMGRCLKKMLPRDQSVVNKLLAGTLRCEDANKARQVLDSNNIRGGVRTKLNKMIDAL